MTPMLMRSVIWTVLLLEVCLTVDVSGQTTLTSSLQSTNRMYVCPGEVVTYVCSGVGSTLDLYAPPFVPLNLLFSYARGDTPGRGNLLGPIIANLISTDSPFMVADLVVQNASLPEFSVHCTVRSPSDGAVAQHRPSDPPIDVNSSVIRNIGGPSNVSATVEVTWNHTDGNYDPSHYTIQLFVNTAEPVTVVISAESNSSLAVFSVPFVNTTVSVTARITVTSKCGQTTTGIFTDPVTITQSTSTSLLATECTTSFVFVGIFAAATLILSIVIVVIILGVCFYHKR